MPNQLQGCEPQAGHPVSADAKQPSTPDQPFVSDPCVHHYVMVSGGMACQKCGHVMEQPEVEPRPDSPAASPSRVADLKATLRIAQLDSNDDTNPTWGEFDQALATAQALEAALAYYAEGRYPDGGEIAREALSG